MSRRAWATNEITKILNATIGATDPVGDSSIDPTIEDNLKTLIDITNWCMDGLYSAARFRKSHYRSMADIGERAYASLLEYKDWINGVENELK